MDAFGQEYIAHNLPLLFISGLGPSDEIQGTKKKPEPQEGGFRVKTDLPPIETDLANIVKDVITDHDGSAAPWSTLSAQSKLFTIRNVGRVGLASQTTAWA